MSQAAIRKRNKIFNVSTKAVHLLNPKVNSQASEDDEYASAVSEVSNDQEQSNLTSPSDTKLTSVSVPKVFPSRTPTKLKPLGRNYKNLLQPSASTSRIIISNTK